MLNRYKMLSELMELRFMEFDYECLYKLDANVRVDIENFGEALGYY
jgi:DNA-binding transcriptional ArsR family regulator